MDPTLREHYQWLQTIVYALQLPEWTLEKEIKRKAAFSYIANFAPSLGVDLHPNDPDFLSTVAFRLGQILAAEEKAASIPENLEELVTIYEEHLEESRKKTFKTTFPTLDEKIERLYQEYHQKIKKELSESEKKLVTNPILCEELSHQTAVKLINSLPQTARKEGPGSLSRQDYEAAFTLIHPLVAQEFEKAGIEEVKIFTDRKLKRKFLKNTSEEVRKLSFTPHNTVSLEKLQSLEKERILAAEIPRETPPPKTDDLSLFQLQSTGIRVPLYRKPIALTKKIALAPVAKPVQWLTHFAPEEVREKNLAFVYATRGYTPAAINQTLKYLYQHEPENPEISYWQTLKAVFKAENPPFTSFFKHYYDQDTQGKRIIKTKTIGTSRFAKIVTFGRFENFASLRGSFWKVFKGTKVGGFLSKGAGKILIRLGKFASVLSGVGAALFAMDTFKKGMKAAGAYLFGLLMIAAHYGPAAVTGTLIGGIGGGIVGGIIGFKVGGLIGAAIGGPVGIAIGGTIGFLTGVFIQFAWDKITAAAASTSLAQIGTSFLSQTGMATVSTAKWFVPVAATTSVVGGITVSIIASSAFVIPTERRPSPWAGQSEYIQVEKAVAFAGETNPDGTIDNSEINNNTVFTYQFTITATTATLINITAEDIITTTQESGTNQIETKVWPDVPDLAPGETWTSEPYDVLTRPVNKFTDSILSNTVTVTADVKEENLTGEQSFASTTVTIGNPPQDCPRGWPVNIRPVVITQGPNGSFSHPGQEAIDIGRVGNTTLVTATHKGIAHIGEDSGKGRYVSITSTCKSIIFSSFYAHLGTILVEDGKPVIFGEQIGITDNTGISTGPHLHYEFKSSGGQIKMAPPNIPDSVPYGDTCTDGNPCVY